MNEQDKVFFALQRRALLRHGLEIRENKKWPGWYHLLDAWERPVGAPLHGLDSVAEALRDLALEGGAR